MVLEDSEEKGNWCPFIRTSIEDFLSLLLQRSKNNSIGETAAIYSWKLENNLKLFNTPEKKSMKKKDKINYAYLYVLYTPLGHAG